THESRARPFSTNVPDTSVRPNSAACYPGLCPGAEGRAAGAIDDVKRRLKQLSKGLAKEVHLIHPAESRFGDGRRWCGRRIGTFVPPPLAQPSAASSDATAACLLACSWWARAMRNSP